MSDLPLLVTATISTTTPATDKATALAFEETVRGALNPISPAGSTIDVTTTRIDPDAQLIAEHPADVDAQWRIFERVARRTAYGLVDDPKAAALEALDDARRRQLPQWVEPDADSDGMNVRTNPETGALEIIGSEHALRTLIDTLVKAINTSTDLRSGTATLNDDDGAQIYVNCTPYWKNR